MAPYFWKFVATSGAQIIFGLMRIINYWEMLLTKHFYSNRVAHSLGKFQSSPSFSKSSKPVIYLKDQLSLGCGTAFPIQYPTNFQGGPYPYSLQQADTARTWGRVSSTRNSLSVSKSLYCISVCLITHIMASYHCNLQGNALYLYAWPQTGKKHKALNTRCLTQKQTPDRNFWNPP